MKIGFQEIVIDPDRPVYRMKQKKRHMNTADDLHCRLLFLQGKEKDIFHISIDTVEIQRAYYERIHRALDQALQRKINLIVSATHSHNCPCLTTDVYYQEFVLHKIIDAALSMTYTEQGEMFYSYQYCYFDKIGTSRIEGLKSENIYAEMISFWNKEKRLGSFLIHNVHPTIEKLWTGDFTAEYPGAVISILKKKYPNEFFTFGMGPSGELSSRFVRKSQSHEEMLRLAAKLADKYQQFLETPVKLIPLKYICYEETIFPVKREVRDYRNLSIPETLNEQEKRLLRQCQQEPLINIYELADHHWFSRLIFPGFVMIFEPFELFSEYYDAIKDKQHCTLITVSNGYDDYVTGTKAQPISFELLKDTLTNDTKTALKQLLYVWSQEDESIGHI